MAEEKELLELLKHFYNLTGMKICVFDENCREICYYPEKLCAFCSLLRRDGATDAACVKSDLAHFEECAQKKQTVTYTCHVGLTECIAPILYEGALTGFIMIGQIRRENVPFSEVSAKLENIPADFSEAEKLYSEIQPKSLSKIRSAIAILNACAGYLHYKKLVVNKNRKIDEEIADYVCTHLQEKLGVDLLCRRFRLSRSELYRLTKDYFSCTVGEFVLRERIRKAKELLRNTSLPVHKIAAESGIPDYNYFSKIFKKQTGVSPSAYRAAGR